MTGRDLWLWVRGSWKAAAPELGSCPSRRLGIPRTVRCPATCAQAHGPLPLPNCPPPLPPCPCRLEGLAHGHLPQKLLPLSRVLPRQTPRARSSLTPAALPHTSPARGHPASREGVGPDVAPASWEKQGKKEKLGGIGGTRWGLSLGNITVFSSVFLFDYIPKDVFSSRPFSPLTPLAFNFPAMWF